MAVSYSWGRGTPSKCAPSQRSRLSSNVKSRPRFHIERHGPDLLPTYISRAMAEMGALGNYRSLRRWTCRLVFSSDPCMSALPPTVANFTTTTDILYCVTEDSYHDKLRQCGD